MGIKTDKKKLMEYFKTRESFTTKDLHGFFAETQNGIKRSTVNWRVYELVRQGTIKRTGRGVFSLGNEQDLSWNIQKRQKQVANLIRKNFPLIKFCVWNSAVLKEFYQHIPQNDLLIVETEKDAIDSVFFLLKNSEKNIFKEPTAEIIENYLSDIKNPLVVKPLLSESPLREADGIPVPSLEKILVDLCADNRLFFFLQGNELVKVFRNAFEKYTINKDRLMRYAKRRNKNNVIKTIINQMNHGY